MFFYRDQECVRRRKRFHLSNPQQCIGEPARCGHALYFSRAPIPWHRGAFTGREGDLPSGVEFRRHLGIYAYRAGFLRRFVGWVPAAIEECEALEQLRALWQGERIHVSLASEVPGTGVDTPEDLERVRRMLP